MFEGLTYLELSGKKIPIKCDMCVLEKIQDTYGNISRYEWELIGFHPSLDENGECTRNEEGNVIGAYEVPDIKLLNQALIWQANEGWDIEEENGKEAQRLTDKQLLRAVDISPAELGRKLREEFARCFTIRKNEETTQRTT